MAKITIEGLQQAQAAMLKVIAALKPKGAVGIATQEMTIRAFRWVVTQTHVDTGTLKASRRMEVHELKGIIYTVSGINPKTGKSARAYDVPEQARGGSHQTYVNFIATQALAVGRMGIITMLRNLP